MFTGVNIIDFTNRFVDNESCYQYLLEMKWGKGYSCSRCGCKEYGKGKKWYCYRCKGCGYDESVTANTIFHAMKMPILKAFHLVFRVSAKKKGMSTVELGAEVGVEQKTAWLFKRKMQVAMQDNNKLKDNIDADETIIGGYRKGKENRGRSLKNKQAALIAIERLEDGRTGNINFEVIENFKATTLECALKEMIKQDASIHTDKLSSYESLKEQFNISTELSKKGSSMEELHKQIMLFKNWLRGIHHKCSAKHLFAYLDEYKYRFNNRNMRKRIFDNLIRRIMHNAPRPYPVIKTLCAYST